MFSIKEIFDLAIQIEKNGEAFYRDALKEISNPSLKSLLEWLADQEVKHITWFSEKKEKLGTNEDDLQLDEMARAMLQEVLGDQSFSLKDSDLSKIDDIDALLELAIEFEKDSIVFYEMIGGFIDDVETSSKLKEIIEEENRHIQLLQEFEDEEVINSELGDGG